MNILALDTSRKTSDASLRLATGEILTRSCTEKNNESLLPMLQALLSVAEMELSQLQALCVCVGPGSFTGLRIGMTTMKSLAQVLGIPLYGLDTLTALQRVAGTDAVPLLDARGGRVYTKKDTKTELVEAADLKKDGQYVAFSSQALQESLCDTDVTWIASDRPLSPVLAAHAEQQLQAGVSGAWRTLLPDYVGVSQAEREREKKLCRE